MEFDYEKFAKLELERRTHETTRQLESMSDEEFLQVIVDALTKIVKSSIELNEIENKVVELEYKVSEITSFLDNCVDPICQDRWGISVYNLDVQFEAGNGLE